MAYSDSASFALFTRKTGAVFGLLSFRPDSCLPLLELLKMSGNPLSLRGKEMVMSCVQFFKKEKVYQKKINANNLYRRTPEALGVSEHTVYRVKKSSRSMQWTKWRASKAFTFSIFQLVTVSSIRLSTSGNK